MKWAECKNIEELKKLGSFKSVKEMIKKDLKGELNLTGRSWSALLIKITLLSDIFRDNQKNEIWHDGFISEVDKYLFCLLNLDGKNRQNNLGVSILHYKNKEIAKKWYKKIVQKIHPDRCTDNKDRAYAAMKVLDEMFKEMAK
jgi:hypothetical protein